MSVESGALVCQVKPLRCVQMPNLRLSSQDSRLYNKSVRHRQSQIVFFHRRQWPIKKAQPFGRAVYMISPSGAYSTCALPCHVLIHFIFSVSDFLNAVQSIKSPEPLKAYPLIMVTEGGITTLLKVPAP